MLLNYIIIIGLFYLEFCDAIKEGDGERVLRCWRYMLPIVHNTGKKNYVKEVFNVLYLHMTMFFHHTLLPKVYRVDL